MKGVIKSTFITFQPNAKGQVQVQLDTLQQHIFEVQFTVDENSLAYMANGYFPSTTGQNGQGIDPTGSTAPQILILRNNPEWKRSDNCYFTFRGTGPFTSAKLFALISYIDTQ